ncbi:MAG TPA: PIN domain-containing protein [Candidatus Eisenbacteria bacterium]|nr:PIN domain-containing protein [Candidatus Eisenbacteria bacterium]
MKRFMLDTDTVSFVLRNEGAAASNLSAHRPSEICLSSITLCELRFGADKRRSKRIHGMIDGFVATIEALPFDSAAAAMFGKVRASLESKGTPIGMFDTLIAAHALALDLTLVTNNTRHFSNVRGLRAENWSE